MMNNAEQPPQSEINEVAMRMFETLKQKMSGRDLIFKDRSGNRRFFVLSSPAGTINLHDCETGYDHTLWSDGTVETADTSDIDGEPVRTVRAQELESMLREVESLQEEEMEHPKDT